MTTKEAVEKYPLMNAGPETTLKPLSQSKQLLMACPYLYCEREIRGIADAPNQYKERGTQIHNVMAQYIDHCVKTKQAFDYEHLEKLMEQGQLFESIEILQRFKQSLRIDPDKVLDTEMYLALDKDLKPITLPEKNKLIHRSELGVEIEGTLDYVQLESGVSATIFDWKSLFCVIDADTFQSRLYPYLLLKHYDFLTEVRFVLQFVRYNVARDVTYTREQLPELEREILAERRRQIRLHEAAEKLALHGNDVELMQEAAQRLDACPGNHCAWCPKLMASIRANTVCQTTGIMPALDQTTVCPIMEINDWTQHEPDVMLKAGLFFNQMLKKIAGILREHVKAGGVIECMDANGQVYAAEYVESESQFLPAAEGLPILQKWDSDNPDPKSGPLVDRVRIGLTELNPLLKAKKRAALKEQIDAVSHFEPTTKWHIGKKGNQPEKEEGSL